MPRTFQEDFEYHSRRLQAQYPADRTISPEQIAQQLAAFHSNIGDSLGPSASSQPEPPREKWAWKKRELGITSDSQREETIMPVHDKEENVQQDNLTDQVAKESDDSTASSDPIHFKGDKASVMHHQANPGPVMAQDVGQPADKESLKKRAEELNKE